MSSPPSLTIVVPCYNEEAVIQETGSRLQALLDQMVARRELAGASRVLFVDDGSRDATWPSIERLASRPGSRLSGLKLSHNRGHQIAVLAGLLSAGGDVLITVDADLQDDINAIPKMIAAFHEGSEVVYGVRSGRTSDSFFKRFTAEGYYKVLAMLGVEVVFNHADYRLMSRRVVEALREHREINVFLRGLIPLLGFASSQVMYERRERFAGESKYPLSKMLALAWQGVTSFSAAPLRMITVFGVSVSLISLGLAGWALWVRLFTDRAVPGWTSVVVPLFLLSGVQLLSIGVIGEYLAKMYVEVKGRPRFFVEKTAPAALESNATASQADHASNETTSLAMANERE
jgi:glycosyltransferase involved in cell wall biosynthesis